MTEAIVSLLVPVGSTVLVGLVVWITHPPKTPHLVGPNRMSCKMRKTIAHVNTSNCERMEEDEPHLSVNHSIRGKTEPGPHHDNIIFALSEKEFEGLLCKWPDTRLGTMIVLISGAIAYYLCYQEIGRVFVDQGTLGRLITMLLSVLVSSSQAYLAAAGVTLLEFLGVLACERPTV